MPIYISKPKSSGGSAWLQPKTIPATASSQTVLPDPGYDGFSQVTVTPQQHSETYTPAANTASNDMGATHNKRYVNTSGMIVPSGTKQITSNGTVDVSSYASANVNVSSQSLSGNASESDVISGKTFYSNNYTKKTGTFTAQEVSISIPSGETEVITPDSGKYLSKVTATAQPSLLYPESKRATMDSETYQPDTGYDGFSEFTVLPQRHTSSVAYRPQPDTINNDLGQYHNIRYVDTTDMIIPSGNKSITSNGTDIDITDKKTVSVSVQPVIDNTNNVGTPMENSQTITPNTGEYFAQFHIDAIPSEYIIPSGNKEITANGTDIDVSSYATASVNVDTDFIRTTLWTNSSPSAGISEKTNVTLSSIYSIHDYISIKYRPTASSTTTKEILVPVRTFMSDRIVIGAYTAGTTGVDPYYHIRAIYATSTTNVVIDKAYKTNGNNGVSTRLIPTEITGLYKRR